MAAKKLGTEITVEQQPEVCVVKIAGEINENTSFPVITTNPDQELVLDLKGVVSLNSMGLRNWLAWVKQFKTQTRLRFRFCTRCVVDQMNILQGFIPIGALVESFYVPYHCESCSHSEDVLAMRGKDFTEATADARESILLPDERECLKCKDQMVIDTIPYKYFNFLKYRK